MKYIEDKFALTTVTEDLFEKVLDIYNTNEDTVYIGLFMIHGDFHRQVYGKAFIVQFTKAMKEKGYSRLKLGVLKQNKKGFKFWIKMGFEVVKEVISTTHPERTWEIKVMEKSIN